jgi:uncharacterized protein (TIGR02265 family)
MNVPSVIRVERESLVDFRVRYARPLGFVAPYCDIVDRLELAPATARLRGILFRAITEEMVTHGKLERYREFFDDDYSAIPYYPLSDYIVRLAVAGALITTPQTLHEGMYELSRSNAKSFAGSLLGRTLIRLLARDPLKLTEQGIAARRQMSSYGRWSIIQHNPREIEVKYENEYVWIESAVTGSAAGSFEGQGMTVTVETKLTDPFNGSTIVRW